MVTGRQCDARSGEVCVGLAGQAEPGKWGSVGGGPAVLDVDTHWQEHWGRAASWRSPGWLSLVPGRHRRPSRRGQPRAASCRTRDRRPGLRTATCRRVPAEPGRTAAPRHPTRSQLLRALAAVAGGVTREACCGRGGAAGVWLENLVVHGEVVGHAVLLAGAVDFAHEEGE